MTRTGPVVQLTSGEEIYQLVDVRPREPDTSR